MHIFASAGRHQVPDAEAMLSVFSARTPEMLLETKNAFKAFFPVNADVSTKDGSTFLPDTSHLTNTPGITIFPVTSHVSPL